MDAGERPLPLKACLCWQLVRVLKDQPKPTRLCDAVASCLCWRGRVRIWLVNSTDSLAFFHHHLPHIERLPALRGSGHAEVRERVVDWKRGTRTRYFGNQGFDDIGRTSQFGRGRIACRVYGLGFGQGQIAFMGILASRIEPIRFSLLPQPC